MSFDAVLDALCEADSARKCSKVAALVWNVSVPHPPLPTEEPTGLPGRPARPQLIAPRDVPVRGFGSTQGRVALCHAVAHIEFNAINLSLDAIVAIRDTIVVLHGLAQCRAGRSAAFQPAVRAAGAAGLYPWRPARAPHRGKPSRRSPKSDRLRV